MRCSKPLFVVFVLYQLPVNEAGDPIASELMLFLLDIRTGPSEVEGKLGHFLVVRLIELVLEGRQELGVNFGHE